MDNHKEQAAKVGLGHEYQETFHVASKLDPAINGQITVRLPNGKDLMKKAIIEARLREGVPDTSFDVMSLGLLVMLSTLTVVVCKAPDWWYRTEKQGEESVKIPAPENLHDTEMLWEIYGRYSDWRDGFPDRQRPSADSQSPDGAESVAPIADTASQSVQRDDRQSDRATGGLVTAPH